MRIAEFLTALGMTALVAACGGGSGGGTSPPAAVPDPKITVYSSFDLASSMMTGTTVNDGVYQDCLNSTSQINLMRYARDTNSGALVPQVFTLYGSFTMPNGSSSCSTAGVSGTINSVTFLHNSNMVYGMTGLSIPAVGFKLGYKPFWSAVATQTGVVQSMQVTSAQITCTDSSNTLRSLSLNSMGNMAPFISACL
jgi:hypothetical protein